MLALKGLMEFSSVDQMLNIWITYSFSCFTCSYIMICSNVFVIGEKWIPFVCVGIQFDCTEDIFFFPTGNTA